MPVLRYSMLSTVAVALLAATPGLAPAQAGQAIPFAAPLRPSPAGSGAIGLATTLGAIIEAELAAKEQKVQASANPFLKPRPRPNREHIASSKPGNAGGNQQLRPVRFSGV